MAAYCRVSTETEEQASSYEAQIEHYTDYIQRNPEWQLAGIFADDGISGTNTRKREEFNHMIDECMAGNIDMIITKSISRFARNTLDCLKFIRLLKEKNIAVFFEKENINTMDAKGEVLITIMASLAQQESQSFPQNVKIGLQYRYQQGRVQVNHNRFLGYTKDADGNLIIDSSQSETVKRIYREYLDGASMDRIAHSLEADGILNGAGNAHWHASNIRQILTNEKYMGDALLQKTVTTDFLTKTRIKNNGTVPQYYVKNNHAAIIPKELFLLVQEELLRRRSMQAGGKKRNYSCNHCFAQIVTCGECGEIYRRVHWSNHGNKSIVWRCVSRLEAGNRNCTARTVTETQLEQVVIDAINMLMGDRDNILETLQHNLEAVILDTSSIDARLDELQQELSRTVKNDEAYEAIVDEIYRLREEKEQTCVNMAKRDEQKRRVTELHGFIMSQSNKAIAFDEGLVRRMVSSITVFADRFVVEFKSGASVNI